MYFLVDKLFSFIEINFFTFILLA